MTAAAHWARYQKPRFQNHAQGTRWARDWNWHYRDRAHGGGNIEERE